MINPHPKPNQSIGLAVLVFGQMAIGSAALMARVGLDAGFGAFPLAAWRLTVASLCIVVAMALLRQTKREIPKNALILVVAGICLGLHFATWFMSLTHISIAISTLLVSTSPIWAGLFEAIFLRKKPSRTFWIGLTLAFVGLAVITLSSNESAKGSVWLGSLWAIVGSLFLVVYMFLTQRSQRELGTWRTVSWTYSSAAISLWGVTLLGLSGNAIPTAPPIWASVIGMALFAQIIGHTSMNWSLRHFSAGVVGVALLLEPVFAAALAWPIYGEPISLVQGVGALVLLGGVGVVLSNQATAEPCL